ncbi:MAG: hypothetical protein ACKVU0_16680 [Saprospiraceae bacterium]
MSRRTRPQIELEDFRQKLYGEFVAKFDLQPKEGRLASYKDLLRFNKIGDTTLWRAFTNAKEMEKENAEDRLEATAACATAYEYLAKYWQVSDECVFTYIGLEMEEPGNKDNGMALHPRFPKEEVAKCLAQCQEDIRIIDTYPSFMLDDEDNPDEINFLDWANQSGKKVRLLVLNPSGRGIDLRINAAINKPNLFEMPVTAFRIKLVEVFRNLMVFSKENPNLLEVKLMDDLPAFHGIIMPACGYFGFHFSHKLSHKATFIEVKGKNLLYKDSLQHFEHIWNSPERAFKLDQGSFDKIESALAQKNHVWESLKGRWEVYFQDKWKEDTSSPVSKISRAVIEIDPPFNSGPMSARLYFQDADMNRLRLFDGQVRFERLKEGEFAFLVFSDRKYLSIRLIVRCILGERLYGHWVLINSQDLNSSACILTKANQHKPVAPAFDIPIEKGVISTLALRNRHSFSLAAFAEVCKTHTSNKKIENYEGPYEMYAYGMQSVQQKNGTKLKKGIQLNCIHIASYGFVRYKSLRTEAKGVASINENNLYLTLTDDDRNYRVGYFIFYTKDRQVKENGVLAGIFLGISLRDQLPVARRIVLVKSKTEFDDVQPNFIVANSDEYKNLDEGIKKALSGRIKNLIGFLRSNSGIFNLTELFADWKGSKIFEENEFFEFACFYAEKGDKQKAIQLFERAVEFGFYDLEKFEEAIEKSPVRQEILSDEDYLSIKRLITEGD